MPRQRRRNYYIPEEFDSDSNEARQAEANQINMAALAQQRQIEGEPVRYASNRDRELAIATSDATDRAHNDGMAMLASMLNLQETKKGLMSETTQRPSDGVLQAAYYGLPEDRQAELYTSGAAPFVNGETGMKMLENSAKAKDNSFHAQVNEIGNRIASGHIFFENDEHGTPVPYSITDDPNASDADKLLGKGKKKQQLGMMEMHLLREGMRRGFIPDIDTIRPKAPVVAPVAAAQVANLAPAKIELSPEMQAKVAQGMNPTVANIRQTIGDAATGDILPRASNIPTHITNAIGDVYNAGKGAVNLYTGGLSNMFQLLSGSTKRIPQLPTIQADPIAFGDYTPKQVRPDYGDY